MSALLSRPPSGDFVLFIRHAERAALPPEDPFRDVDLTPQGYADVECLAATLQGRLRWTAASPFLRCRVTAKSLGFAPEDDTRLGRHGPWVFDAETAGREFVARGTEGVVRALIAGLPLEGMRDSKAAVPLLLSAGLDRAARGPGVCVSHDAVLMPAMAWLFGDDAAADWLEPLDGFLIEFRADGPVACWRGRERCLGPSVLSQDTLRALA